MDLHSMACKRALRKSEKTPSSAGSIYPTQRLYLITLVPEHTLDNEKAILILASQKIPGTT